MEETCLPRIEAIKRRDNITNNHEHKDAKVVIKSRTSKGRQYHGQNRQKKSTDNDMKNTAQATRTPGKTGLNSGASEG